MIEVDCGHDVLISDRKAAVRTPDKLWDTIGLLLDAFSPAECANYLKHSGYVQPTWEML